MIWKISVKRKLAIDRSIDLSIDLSIDRYFGMSFEVMHCLQWTMQSVELSTNEMLWYDRKRAVHKRMLGN